MIYIFTAFYAEAKSIITRYNLKMQQKQAAVRFDVFSNDDIMLVITGVGEINAASAVANIGGAYGIGADDVLVNIGSCAGSECMISDTMPGENMCTYATQDENKQNHKRGCVFLINKITEQSTGRTFYPDMLLKSDMDECEAVTVSKPLTAEEMGKLSDRSVQVSDICKNDRTIVSRVYDMEAAAVYQAASLFVGPHRMHFIKVVSDSGEKIDQSHITEAFAAVNDKICGYIDKLIVAGNTNAIGNIYAADNAADSNISCNINCNINSIAMANVASGENKYPHGGKIYGSEQLIRDMKCSKVMGDQLRQLIKYCILSGIDYESVIKEFYSLGKLPCKSKKDGKICLEELKNRLL